MYHSIELYDFRKFKNMSFHLGKYITVIAGQNATGKSTLLGILGNACELKKATGKTVFDGQFRAEFGELFKASSTYDISGSKRIKINFTDASFSAITDYREFRTAWQEDKTRFRLIPSFWDPLTQKKKESKFVWPVLYLGLGRLFPIGEVDDSNINFSSLSLSTEEQNWLNDNYRKIVDPTLQITDTSVSKIKNITSKNAFGISTDEYDYLSNSSGQDNIGQILLALLSFMRLSRNPEYTYTGGMLLIDEFDATLHPAVQKRLFNFIFKEICKKFNLQVVLTTHSGELLEYITKKTEHNLEDYNNDIQLIYLTTANIKLDLKINPSWTFIKNDLNDSSEFVRSNLNRIPVYTEDPETKWFAEKLLAPYVDKLEFIAISLSCTQLAKLREGDPRYFSKILFILDGDSRETTDETLLKAIERDNVLLFPGTTNPEQTFYQFLLALDPEDDFWTFCSDNYPDYGFSIRFFTLNGTDSEKYSNQSKQRQKDKQWFRDYKAAFERIQLYDLWERYNTESVTLFRNEFKDAYNGIATRLSLPQL